jgi:hypothetical protein
MPESANTGASQGRFGDQRGQGDMSLWAAQRWGLEATGVERYWEHAILRLACRQGLAGGF